MLYTAYSIIISSSTSNIISRSIEVVVAVTATLAVATVVAVAVAIPKAAVVVVVSFPMKTKYIWHSKWTWL